MIKSGGKKDPSKENNRAKTAKEAPSNLPQKKWWQTTLWAVAMCAWVVTIVIGVQFLVGLPLVKLLPSEIISSSIFNVFFSVVTYTIALLMIIYLPPIILKGKVKKSSRDSLGLRGLPTWTDIGLAPVGYVASIILAAILTMIFSLFPWFNEGETQDLGFSPYMMGLERGIVFILLAVVAPIAEELIFRGWLYGKLRVRIPKWVAIIATSLVFGLIHMQWNVGITVFAMSVVCCSLREVTGTIYAGILVHMINNSIAFFLVYVLGMV